MNTDPCICGPVLNHNRELGFQDRCPVHDSIPCGWPSCQSGDGVDRTYRTCTGQCLADKIRAVARYAGEVS